MLNMLEKQIACYICNDFIRPIVVGSIPTWNSFFFHIRINYYYTLPLLLELLSISWRKFAASRLYGIVASNTKLVESYSNEMGAVECFSQI